MTFQPAFKEQTEIGSLLVSTVGAFPNILPVELSDCPYLPVGYEFPSLRPMFYETAIFSGDEGLVEISGRYDNEEDARKGHADTVARVLSGDFVEDE